jgi:uncharacterized protein YeaO (DUF488 family)
MERRPPEPTHHPGLHPIADRLQAVRFDRLRRPPDVGDGTRVLVDRVWPSGAGAEDAAVDHWLKEIAPSDELLRWYGDDAERFEQFAERYRRELLTAPEQGEALRRLRQLARAGRVTLLTGTADVRRSHAAVLAGMLGRGA